MNVRFKNILLDIRFYLILLFVLRLYGITEAPMESSHSWRQCITNMIARNFSEMGLDFMHPRVDLGGEKTGILGAEFPLLNALIYFAHSIFGFQHWYGRLINLLVSTTGLFYFYQLTKNLFSKKLAFNATLLLALSVWFMFSRKIMPDTFSVSLVIIGLYYGYLYLIKGKWKNIFLYFLFCTLGILCKIPALSIFSVIVSVLFIQDIHFKRKWTLLVIGGISVLIASAWYFLWVPHLVATYHYQLYIPKGILEGILEIKPLFGKLLKRFYFDSFHSYVAFGCFLGGIVFLVKNKRSTIMKCLGIITIMFLLFICKTGNVFPLHSYYIIPFVPVMAIVAAYFLTQIPLTIQYLLLGIIAIESLANQHHDLRVKEKNRALIELEDKVNAFIPKDDLIITSGGRAPQNMYFAHRKGWVAFDHNVVRKKFTDSLATVGAKYLLIRKSDLEYNNKSYRLVYDDKYFSFYDLNKTQLK